MLLVRKIDRYGQAMLAALMILSVPFLFIYGFLAGLLILGGWQLISAAMNTTSFLYEGYRSKILSYWKLCIADLLALLLCWLAGEFIVAEYAQVLFWLAVAGSIPIAIYYWKIYSTLVEHLLLNNELHGVIKSKH